MRRTSINSGRTDSVSERNCFLIEAEVGTGFLDS